MRRFVLSLFGAVVVMLGQTSTSTTTLTGIILDPSDAAVPFARLVLKATNGELVIPSDAVGSFRFEGVAPGADELEATAPGFEPVTRKVRIGARAPQPLTIRLALASLKEQVDVPEREGAVSPQASGNADTISVERTMLDNLPFLDSNYIAALGRFLDPGTPGNAGTSIIVDGMEMRNVGVTPSAIQEIRINNNPYTVEYSRWSRGESK